MPGREGRRPFHRCRGEGSGGVAFVPRGGAGRVGRFRRGRPWARRFDDLHLRHDRESQRRVAAAWGRHRQRAAGHLDLRACPVGRPSDVRTGLSQRRRVLFGPASGARRDGRPTTKVRRRRRAGPGRAPSRDHVIHGADAPPAVVDAQERNPRDTSSLRAIILGAAPCPHVLKERAEAVFGQVLWEFYGATETGVNTVLRPEDQLRKPGSCGTAVPGQEIMLVRDDGTEAGIGEPGELMVRSSWGAEYYNRPDATSQSLRDGYFSVGDVAYRDDEGYYYICDPRIDMII